MLRCRVDYRQALALLNQDEIHVRAASLNRARLNVAGNPQPLGKSAVPEALQFFDGDVVALALLHTGIGKITQGINRITTVAPPNFRYLLVSLDIGNFPEPRLFKLYPY